MSSFLDKYIDEEVTYEELDQRADCVMETHDPTPLNLTATEFELFERLGKDALEEIIEARSLGTSINTSFGTNLQKFCSDILSGYASTTSGIDIEFIDFIDGKRKYCQIKAGVSQYYCSSTIL